MNDGFLCWSLMLLLSGIITTLGSMLFLRLPMSGGHSLLSTLVPFWLGNGASAIPTLAIFKQRIPFDRGLGTKIPDSHLETAA